MLARSRAGAVARDRDPRTQYLSRMGWLIPSLAYVVLTGALGVTVKLATRHLAWQEVVLWTAIVYAVIAVVMLIGGAVSLRAGQGTVMALLSGVLAAAGLIVFFIALSHGSASRVVPITSAYPLVTLALSAIVLSEHITPLRVVAAVLVVGGVILLSVAS